ncbi:hypothetical protein, partial [Nocardioides sp.]|uniref:hypothetical protein n=1 Tax=Nocardioides sp. TaxID=35761 RepID=UPI002ED9D0B7
MDPETTHTPDRPTSDASARRPGHRTWRGPLAGAIAGGVLAASVAVPVTWATLRDDGTDTVAQQTTSASGTDLEDLQSPAWGQPGPSTGTGTGTGNDAATATAASEKQSRGVVLIDTTLVDGEAAGTGLVIDATG